MIHEQGDTPARPPQPKRKEPSPIPARLQRKKGKGNAAAVKSWQIKGNSK